MQMECRVQVTIHYTMQYLMNFIQMINNNGWSLNSYVDERHSKQWFAQPLVAGAYHYYSNINNIKTMKLCGAQQAGAGTS